MSKVDNEGFICPFGRIERTEQRVRGRFVLRANAGTVHSFPTKCALEEVIGEIEPSTVLHSGIQNCERCGRTIDYVVEPTAWSEAGEKKKKRKK